MIRKFRGNQRSPGDMQKAVDDMLELFNKFHSGEIPNENYTLDDLKKLCESLIEAQETMMVKDCDGNEIEVGYWYVSTNPSMPSDASVDFLYFPTYIAISMLTKFMQRYPEIAKSIPNYMDTLKKGYRGASLRELRGHGFEALEDMIRALKILNTGGVIEYLSKNPDFSPELFNVLKSIKKLSEYKIKNGIEKISWSELSLEEYKWICETLKTY